MKEKRHKLKPQLIIVLVAAVIILIALITAGIISSKSKSKDNNVGMTLTQKNLRPQDTQVNNSNEPKEKTSVEILMDDTAIPVGTTLIASAIVEPADTDKALVWASSNQDVMTVDQNGLITIKGTGTAALTATVGDVSDAVAIEGIESVTAGSKNGYVVYTGKGSSAGKGTSTGAASGSSSVISSGNTGNTGNASGGSEEYLPVADNNSSNSDGSGNNDNNNNASSNNGSDSSSNNNQNSGSTGSSNNDSQNSSGSSATSGSFSDSKGKTSDDIAGVLDGQGFTKEYSNVYVYTENGTYYGEIITQPNVSIIYIKTRSSGFDSRIKSVLAQLLPDSYEQVWNNYVSASSDRTFTVEDRKVRIVTAAIGGHSQIVIYN